MHNQHNLISVIIATYNRSNVLRFAIETVIKQTHQNWELIIIGDCCTDDTKEVIESFRNEKIKFINLEKNIGEQSGPNNYGVSIANGSYIAYLNHDDLWFPNHLESLYQKINSGDYDLIYSHYYCAPIDGKLIPVALRANDKHDNFHPAPASTWLFKKQLFTDIGPWEFYKKTNNSPSQVWLLKVAKSKKIGIVNTITIIAVQSGARLNSYKNREYKENEFYFEALNKNPDALLKEIYYNQFLWLKIKDSKNAYHVKAIARNLTFSMLEFFGLTLWQIKVLFNHPGKGSFVDYLRKVRGLPKI
jgi:glycosyltransferase involved in cell wall biosynthesis